MIIDILKINIVMREIQKNIYIKYLKNYYLVI